MVDNQMSDDEKIRKFEEWAKKDQERKNRSKKERENLREKFGTLTNPKLHSKLEQKLPAYYWRLECHLDGMDGKQKVDIIGESILKDFYICIEVERGRPQAINNIVKIWRYIEENLDSMPVRFIHIFSPYFYEKIGNKRRMKECIFIGKQAEKSTNKIKYEPLGQEYWPSAKESDLNILVEKISSLIM